jgi:hypothetical protein
MVRVRQVAWWANGNKAEDKNNGAEANGEDLQVCVITDGTTRLAGVESG